MKLAAHDWSPPTPALGSDDASVTMGGLNPLGHRPGRAASSLGTTGSKATERSLPGTPAYRVR